ncbi:hypothetical protein L596_028948 [Steinernema carpocapsae]|uniref:Uncharacterized protein n=1 Tax=Steinernema carpocapsae TaxID=34508 RepID=A0A4U5LZU7_STECR|nr:hypothetical protein L596_028948 [Steinernema carpocapsae]
MTRGTPQRDYVFHEKSVREQRAVILWICCCFHVKWLCLMCEGCEGILYIRFRVIRVIVILFEAIVSFTNFNTTRCFRIIGTKMENTTKADEKNVAGSAKKAAAEAAEKNATEATKKVAAKAAGGPLPKLPANRCRRARRTPGKDVCLSRKKAKALCNLSEGEVKMQEPKVPLSLLVLVCSQWKVLLRRACTKLLLWKALVEARVLLGVLSFAQSETPDEATERKRRRIC